MTKTPFIYSDWLQQYPFGCRIMSVNAKLDEDRITLESLHRRLGDRRTTSRDGLDLLSHLEQLSNALS